MNLIQLILQLGKRKPEEHFIVRSATKQELHIQGKGLEISIKMEAVPFADSDYKIESEADYGQYLAKALRQVADNLQNIAENTKRDFPAILKPKDFVVTAKVHLKATRSEEKVQRKSLKKGK